MILPESFQKDWIYSHRERPRLEKINPPLVEKMIYALALVIQNGLLQFKPYQMTSLFRIEEAIVASAKAAYMAAKIKADTDGVPEMFQKDYTKQDFLIQNPEYGFLNKLQTEALFYWFKSLEILKFL